MITIKMKHYKNRIRKCFSTFPVSNGMGNKIKNKIAVFGYVLLEKLPSGGGLKTEVSGLSDYLSWLYKFALAAAAFLAVLMIVIGGIQMIVGGASETARSDGKKRIEQAIWGLLLAITAWLILNSINPDLVKTGLTIPYIEIEAPMAATESTGTGDIQCYHWSDYAGGSWSTSGTFSSVEECEEKCKPGGVSGKDYKCVIFKACTYCLPGASCTDCHKLEGVKIKTEGKGACEGGVDKCKVAPLVLTDLSKLKTTASGLSWQVTEAYPPTVKHSDTCHSKGTCVDAALTGTVTKEKVKEFMEAAKAAGFTKVVCEYKEYPELGCKEYPTTTGGSLHLEI